MTTNYIGEGVTYDFISGFAPGNPEEINEELQKYANSYGVYLGDEYFDIGGSYNNNRVNGLVIDINEKEHSDIRSVIKVFQRFHRLLAVKARGAGKLLYTSENTSGVLVLKNTSMHLYEWTEDNMVPIVTSFPWSD
jgi:hypothetical protein